MKDGFFENFTKMNFDNFYSTFKNLFNGTKNDLY